MDIRTCIYYSQQPHPMTAYGYRSYRDEALTTSRHLQTTRRPVTRGSSEELPRTQQVIIAQEIKKENYKMNTSLCSLINAFSPHEKALIRIYTQKVNVGSVYAEM